MVAATVTREVFRLRSVRLLPRGELLGNPESSVMSIDKVKFFYAKLYWVIFRRLLVHIRSHVSTTTHAIYHTPIAQVY